MPQTPPPLQPEQASFARDIALRNLAAEHPVTRRVLDAIPIEKGDYRPDAVAKSALDLAWHIVAAEHRFMDAVVTGRFDISNTGRPETLTTTAEVSQVVRRRVRGRSAARRGAARGTADEPDRFPRDHHVAGRHLPDDRAQALDSPSRPAVDVPAPDGREGDRRFMARATTARRHARRMRETVGTGRVARSHGGDLRLFDARAIPAGRNDAGSHRGAGACLGRYGGRIVGRVQASGAAVVVLEPKGARTFAAQSEKPVMDQVSLSFGPELLFVRTGQPAEFRNSDDTLHNVNVKHEETREQAFNVAIPTGSNFEYTFRRDGFYRVGCDIHPAMTASDLRRHHAVHDAGGH
jgi:plastocyanin